MHANTCPVCRSIVDVNKPAIPYKEGHRSEVTSVITEEIFFGSIVDFTPDHFNSEHRREYRRDSEGDESDSAWSEWEYPDEPSPDSDSWECERGGSVDTVKWSRGRFIVSNLR